MSPLEDVVGEELATVAADAVEEPILEDFELTRPIPPGSSMTPRVVRNILAHIAAGNYVSVACKASGVSQRTYYFWLQTAQSNPDSVYGEFAALVDKAFAAAEAANIHTIRKAAATSWQAAAWLEERKHPDRWGQRSRTEVTGVDGGPIQVTAAALIAAVRKDNHGQDD